MLQRLVAGCFALAAVVYASEHRTHASERVGARRVTARDEAPAPLVPQLQVAIGPTVDFTLKVTNPGPRTTEIRFVDGQTHDFEVQDASGRTVWRWSSGRMFTQALRTQALEKGASVEYAERWTPTVPKGPYTVTATLRSAPEPIVVQQVIALH